MIGISKLYCGTVEASDPLRYGRKSQQLPSHLLQFSHDKKPVVVWNVGRRCNLHCRHCYSQSRNELFEGELTHEEGIRLIDDLAAFGVPVLLFSGGEPLMRPDIMPLLAHARQRGMRTVLSTNGTLITEEVAGQLREQGLSYVGISLDGLAETNDRFRGMPGAFVQALEGIHRCQEAGIKVGLRFTMNRRNIDDLDGIFSLIAQEGIPRVCFYHLVYTGRAHHLISDDLSHDETRRAVDLIIKRTSEAHAHGTPLEVLTVDNHCDGPYLYLRLRQENPARAAEVLRLLQMNGGNGSGISIGCVSWDGTVYPDQFWRDKPLGNVRERSFGDILTDTDNEFLNTLKQRKPSLQGRCAGCRWLSICNGNLRVRAEAITGNLWDSDPACYLSDEEISSDVDCAEPVSALP